MYNNFISVDGKKLEVKFTVNRPITDEEKNMLMERNPLVNIVVRDVAGSMYFCRECEDADFREITEDSVPQKILQEG